MRHDAILVSSAHNGVANRVLALGAFAVLAEIDGPAPLFCCWQCNAHCEQGPEDFFDRSSFFWMPLWWKHWDSTTAMFENPRVCVGYWTVGLWTSFITPELTGLAIPKLESRMNRWLRQLQPAERVRQKLEYLSRDWPPQQLRVGVHIRRTDLKPANGQDHPERDRRLQQRADRLLDEEPESRWIVAADNAESLAAFTRRYGKRVLSTQPCWEKHGIRHTHATATAVDLFALASCRRIIGTNASTFGQLAGRLRDIPVEYAGG